MTGAARGAAPPRKRDGRWSVVQLFFNGAGRLGRLPFAVGIAVVALGWRLWRATPGRGLHLVLGPVAGVVLAAAACTVFSKRLHDLGLAGWWSAAPVGLAMLAVGGEAPASPAEITAALAALAVAVALALWPGEAAFNRFGPPT